DAVDEALQQLEPGRVPRALWPVPVHGPQMGVRQRLRGRDEQLVRPGEHRHEQVRALRALEPASTDEMNMKNGLGLAFASFAAGLAGCYSPAPADGRLACGPGDSCPEGYQCFLAK